MSCFPGAYRNRPAGQFFLYLSGNGRGIARNNQFFVFNLVFDAAFLYKQPHVVPGELSRPRIEPTQVECLLRVAQIEGTRFRFPSLRRYSILHFTLIRILITMSS